MLVVALVGLALAPNPLAGLTPRGISACALLALFAIWTLLSGDWSHATGRALVSFDRVLLYLGVLALFSCVPRSEGRFRWLLRGLLLGTATVSLIGLASRLLPALWPTTQALVNDRLNYPVTYWNTLGLLVGMACILAVHHASDEHEPAGVRIGAAALLPPLGGTLLLTFSRGAIAVTVLGILIYALAARPRGVLGGLLAVALPTAYALSQTYSAELVHEGTPLTPAALAQGHHLALILAICAVAAGALRALALPLDSRLARVSTASPERRRAGQALACGVGALALVAFVVGGGPGLAHRQYEKFVDNTHEAAPLGTGQRGRLLDVGNDGRLPLWDVAHAAYRQDPLKGTGAGTYQLQWERRRTESHEHLYAYSLYFESLAELGLVGLVLLGGSLLTILIGIALLMRGPGRAVYAAAFALALAWIVHAGLDIDWQTPAVCVPIFALGGLALARPRERESGLPDQPQSRSPRIGPLVGLAPGWPRPVLALACLAIALVPGQMAIAQSHLQGSVEALNRDACTSAQADAHDAISSSDTGPRPYEVLAMCAARRDDSRAAVRWAKRAVVEDPESWEPHYALALAEGAAGLDPRPQVRTAGESDPRSPLLHRAVAAFRGASPARWRNIARTLPFPIG